MRRTRQTHLKKIKKQGKKQGKNRESLIKRYQSLSKEEENKKRQYRNLSED